MALLRFIVPVQWDWRRLDSFLRQAHQVSGTMLRSARRRDRGLTMNGEPIRTIDPVRAGALVTVDTGTEDREYPPMYADVPVVFEDDSFVVFNKPAGMPVHPSRGHTFDTLGNVFAAREKTAGMVYRPLGRLDRFTSGIVAVAKNAHAAHGARLEKSYLAVLCGTPHELSGEIDAPIASDPQTPRRFVGEGGKSARTVYRVLLGDERFCLAQVWIKTGRTHQIRVHMAHIGHPLAGDGLYGGDMGLFSQHALHCHALRLWHPMREEWLSLSSPLRSDMHDALCAHFGPDAVCHALKKAYHLDTSD